VEVSVDTDVKMLDVGEEEGGGTRGRQIDMMTTTMEGGRREVMTRTCANR
jgi:hypothetical protein